MITTLLAAPNPYTTGGADFTWLGEVPWQKALNILLGALIIGVLFGLAIAFGGLRQAQRDERPGDVSAAKKRLLWEVAALFALLLFLPLTNILFNLAP